MSLQKWLAFFAVILLGSFPIFGSESPQYTQEDSLVTDVLLVQEEHFDPHTVTLILNMQNISDKPVEAFTLEVESGYSDGTTSRTYLTNDTGVAPVPTPLLPGESRQLKVAGGSNASKATVSLSAVPIAVVFQDLSQKGRTFFTDLVFRNRESSYLAQLHWIEAIEKAVSTHNSPEELSQKMQVLVQKLENHSDFYGQARASSQNSAAQTMEKDIARDLRKILKEGQPQDLLSLLLAYRDRMSIKADRLRGSVRDRE